MLKRLFTMFFILATALYSCKDQVKEFSGFTQKELEYLLASDEGKVWQRLSRQSDGEDITLTDCELEHYYIFLPGNTTGNPKDLYFAYDPTICDSLEICDLYPDYCKADTAFCSQNPDICENRQPGILYIGTWYARAPFIENSRSDTLILEINSREESVHVTDITANFATFLYKERIGPGGGEILEDYRFIPATSEE